MNYIFVSGIILFDDLPDVVAKFLFSGGEGGVGNFGAVGIASCGEFCFLGVFPEPEGAEVVVERGGLVFVGGGVEGVEEFFASGDEEGGGVCEGEEVGVFGGWEGERIFFFRGGIVFGIWEEGGRGFGRGKV